MTRSLRGQLLAWVLLPLCVAVAVDAAITWQEADHTATVAQQRLLMGSARMIAEQLRYEDNVFVHPIPPAALELFQSADADHVFYRVTTLTGQLLTGTSELPLPRERSPRASPGFFDAWIRGQPVHGVAVVQPVIGAIGDAPVLVQVAQTLNGRQALRASLWRRSVGDQMLILLLTAAMVVLGLRRGLNPVMRLREAVLARPAGTLEPLSGAGVPLELMPLLDALNDYVRRLQAHTEAQKTFIENAAHQLRTPLTLLSTQVSVARRARDPVALSESLDALRHSLQKAVRVVHQMLTLSSAQSRGDARQDFGPVSLTAVTHQALEDLAGQAHAKQIDLGFESDGTLPMVDGHAVMLHEMVVNLVDNAIRYTPAGGVVTARITAVGRVARLSIEDDGPGIAQADRERVFERFVRLDERHSSGSGLGLAIVRELAQLHGADIGLAGGQGGRGLCVTLSFVASFADFPAEELPAA